MTLTAIQRRVLQHLANRDSSRGLAFADLRKELSDADPVQTDQAVIDLYELKLVELRHRDMEQWPISMRPAEVAPCSDDDTAQGYFYRILPKGGDFLRRLNISTSEADIRERYGNLDRMTVR